MRLRLDTPLIPVALGVALRLLNDLILKSTPVLKILLLDSGYYHQWAREIAQGEVLGKGAFFMSPLYPYVMGLIYALFGSKPMMVVVLQVLLSGLTLWMIWWLGYKLGGRVTGLVAVWAGAIFPVWIYFDGVILTASLILFLNTVGLWAMVRWFENKAPLFLVVAGFAWGLSVLTRPNILLFILVVALWLFLKRQHLASVVLILWALVAISPVTIRNLLIGKEFALTTVSGGMNFFVGNNAQATGLYVEPDFLRSSDPKYELEDYIAEAEKLSWQKLTPGESSRFWYKMGFLYLLNHPLKAVELGWNKFFYFWNNLEAPNNVSIYLVKRYSPIVRFLPLGFGLIASLGIVGLLLMPSGDIKKLIWIYLICLLAANMLYFTSSEFRFPIVSVLLLGVGFTIKKVWRWIKEKRWDWKLVGVLLLMLFFTHYQTDLALTLKSPRMDYYNYGSVTLKNGDYQKAVRFFLLSLSEDPIFPSAHIGLGFAFYELGEYRHAVEEFQMGGYPLTEDFLRQQKERFKIELPKR
jgi:4-amino-4-deoxy-L-arabinose transferase-like glycosyltransferase